MQHSKPFQVICDASLLILYCATIFFLSSRPITISLHWFPHQDKVVHFGAFFVMGIFAWRFFRHCFKKPGSIAIVSFLFSSLYGLSDEWHQSFVPGRHADIVDWLADSSGAALLVIILYRISKSPKKVSCGKKQSPKQ